MWQSVIKFVAENYQVISICGAMFAFYKWHISQRQKEVETLQSLIATLRKPEVLRFVRKADYEGRWYDAKFHDSELEEVVDGVLTEYSYLCHLRKTRMISQATFDFFRYDIESILSDPQMIDYLYNLYQYTRKVKTMFPFIHLLEYGFKHGYAKREIFNDSNAWKNKTFKLHNYLNKDSNK